jgi:hypothetical protein
MRKDKEEKNEIKPKFDKKAFKDNFVRGEMYHGILIDQKEINKIKSGEKTILFKFFYYQNKLFFILYDYTDIYYSILEDKDILDINQELNPSLEFKDLISLISFLKENLILQNKNLIITFAEKDEDKENEIKENINPDNTEKIYYEFMFNSMVDILSIKWIFKCKKIPSSFVSDLSQYIFINPIHNFLLGIGNLINIPNNLMKSNITGMYNGISIEDAKIMIKCNYLGKKIGFSSSIIELLNNSSSVVNGIKNNNTDDHNNEEDGKNNNKKKQVMNKKNKLWGAMKHRKGEKITFCEEAENEPIIQSNSSDIMMSIDKGTFSSEVNTPSKEIGAVKEKKKKKKQFI